MSALGEGRRYWWVNQNQTHRDEIAGSFLWSPVRNRNGARNQFYENMRLVRPGDLVFSYYGTRVQAVGVVQRSAIPQMKPSFSSGGEGWSGDGWLVDVDFEPVTRPIRPKEFMSTLGPHLPSKYSPLRPNGDGLQSVYLAEVSAEFAAAMLALLGPVALAPVAPDSEPLVEQTDVVLEAGLLRETEREALVRARVGQGVFRANVGLRERGCRVTGTTRRAHLRASHIKPWRDSTNAEKLDGANGLLLAPHVDHLFDSGWISFENSGELLLADSMDRGVLREWSIDRSVGRGFDEEQSVYLEHHRLNVFRAS